MKITYLLLIFYSSTVIGKYLKKSNFVRLKTWKYAIARTLSGKCTCLGLNAQLVFEHIIRYAVIEINTYHNTQN